jgi:hypothetical protein
MEETMEFNATEVMTLLGIKKIERVVNRWVVLLDDGRIGIGDDAGKALKAAQRKNAANVLRVAA